MRRLFLFALAATVLVAFGATTVYAGGNKVDVCHIPPGNPDNFHTITISENALSKHLAHGDVGGACNDVCATLCDDQDACTIDDTGDCEQNGCPTIPVLVDCDDTNECTDDSCDPASGCVNDARTGEVCNDDAICTGPDFCNAEGGCEGAEIENCCLDDGWCSDDLCERETCNTEIYRCEADPVSCDPEEPQCQTSTCNPMDGECVTLDANEGNDCNDNDPETCDDVCVEGTCSGMCPPPALCPCWTEQDIALLVAAAAAAGDADCRTGDSVDRITFSSDIRIFRDRMVASDGINGPSCQYRVFPTIRRVRSFSHEAYLECQADVIEAGIELGLTCWD